MGDDILQEISIDDFDNLQKLYLKDWPFGVYIYNFIGMTAQWKSKYKYDVNLYALDGDWSDGTFIAFTRSTNPRDYIAICCFTLDPTNKRLEKALRESKLIEWAKPMNFWIIQKNQHRSLFDVTRSNNCHLEYFVLNSYWWMPKEEAKQLEVTVPENTFLGPLTIEHAEQMYRVWPHREKSSISFIVDMLKYNSGIGLFDKSDSSLMAWITISSFGALSLLQTEEKHQKKGYGMTVLKAICKKFGESGFDPVAFIVVGNHASEALFRKVNFKCVDFICFTCTKPMWG